ncbi:Dna-repair protein xrcc1 [Thalictrum thalictroides]|uniref:Dna-repair protein xrcc1 n=1 Tax=Thalictrum thalictroides TaxID=46969 RepID=A0A7J6WH66_THATH|nr:Dna-repair protein xrcc1 [Thalictrum thalictroides]
MSNSKDPGNKPGRRNLPSWMSSRDSDDDSHRRKKPNDGGGGGRDEDEADKGATLSKVGSNVDTLSFSKLLEGVVFVLSGFVNPERSILRSQAQEMGAEYKPDWNSNCTLLVCAFPNTPKFRQVESDSGTIVSKEWISECYSQKKLVAIETYLMHAGKPWRKNSISHETSHDIDTTPPKKPQMQAERSLPSRPDVSASSKGRAPGPVKECFSPIEVEHWAMNDLNETVSWLESQEETPEPTEVKKIAAEGILTCLQDAIESLEKKQDIRKATEQWNFVPHVVKELARLKDGKSGKGTVTDKDIYEQALTCKHIYKLKFDSLEDDSAVRKKSPKASKGDKDIKKTDIKSTEAAYDSDETIEMTEDEIDLAYQSISSKLCKW